MSKTQLSFWVALLAVTGISSAGFAAPFKIFMISSTAVDHLQMSAAARTALPTMGMANDFTVDATTDSSLINDANLAKYDVFLMMHRAPFEVEVSERAALENFIKSGKGWVGVHAAGLIIPSAYQGRNLPDWPLYNDLIGKVTYVGHPMLQMGTAIMEDRTHPATKNMPATFQIRDEWYEFSGNPRPNVRVLGKADESTYRQNKPQGDHPMIWTTDKYPRVIYTAIGHDASDWQNPAFNILIRDMLLWAAGRLGAPPGDGGVDPVDASSDGSAEASPSGGGGDANSGAGGSGGSAGSTGGGGAGGQAADAAVDLGGGTGGAAGLGGGTGGRASGGTSGAPGGAASSGGCSYSGGTAADSAGWSLLAMMGLALAGRRRRRNVSPLMLPAVFVCFLGGLACGGGSSNPPVTSTDSGVDKPAQSMDTGGPSPDVSGNDTGNGGGNDTPSTTPDANVPGTDVPAGADVGPGVEAGGDMALPKLNVLAIGQLTENGQAEIHAPFVMAAKPWLAQLAAETGMTITHVESPNAITDAMLANYNLILQLNFKPFGWNATAQAAFEKYITEGKGGWVGLHHAGLYGPAVSSMTWPWFFNFFGMINYKAYIATFVQATVRVEDTAHPLFKGVPATFVVTTEEWYTWDKNPRPNVHVLANVDESTYMPNSTIKMGGDHPVIWTNDTVKAKNVYIFMGHSPNLFQNTAWTTLFRNAIFWAGTPK